MTATRELEPALEPVAQRLLARARADAEQTVAGARQEADQVIAHAEDRARVLIEEAAARGRARAEAQAARDRRRLARERRADELRHRAELYRRLRERVRRALRERAAADPSLGARLREHALGRLGPDARITPTVDGGLVAESGTTSLDLSLDVLADRAVDALGDAVEGLWRT